LPNPLESIRLDVERGSLVEELNRQVALGERKPGRGRRRIVWRYPGRQELEYEQALLAVVRALERLTKTILGPLLPIWDLDSRQDSTQRLDQWSEDVVRAVDDLFLRYQANPPIEARSTVQALARATAEKNREEWIGITRAVLGVPMLQSEPWLSGVLADFAVENVKLIQNVAQGVKDNVEGTVLRGFRAGKRHTAVAKDLYGWVPRGVFRKAETRARLIARDQIGKLNGQLTRRRQTEAGATEYIWRTVQDNRVRAEHAEREGKKYAWANPPADGHPGEPINCRCFAEPVFGPEFDSIEVQTAKPGRGHER